MRSRDRFTKKIYRNPAAPAPPPANPSQPAAKGTQGQSPKDAPKKEPPKRKRGPEALGGNWIDFRSRAWILVEEEDRLVETTSLRVSKNGVYVRSLHPIKVGTRVLVLILDKPNRTVQYVRTHKFAMKGKVIDLEEEPMMCKMTVHITLGRVDPSSTMETFGETKYWWTRSWQ